LLKLFARSGLAAIIACALNASSAHAIDIGLLGDQVDPEIPLITNIGFFDLTADGCNVLSSSSFFCTDYEVPNDSYYSPTVVDSIDFRILNSDGQFFTIADIGVTLFASALSDLPNLAASTLFNDGVTLTLYDPLLLSLDCRPNEFCRAEFFSNSSEVKSVSVVGVNGVANPGATAVPEPESLLLFASGLAALLASRRRSALRD
jgi:hypothetical protein